MIGGPQVLLAVGGGGEYGGGGRDGGGGGCRHKEQPGIPAHKGIGHMLSKRSNIEGLKKFNEPLPKNVYKKQTSIFHPHGCFIECRRWQQSTRCNILIS